MDKERFSTLLKDPSQVTNADIKALNEYRKKYPYFQSLYVVVAKALKDREHPKTEAFIKKAAIYSANRAHLKEIIEGDFKFPEKEAPKTQETTQKAVLQEEVKATATNTTSAEALPVKDEKHTDKPKVKSESTAEQKKEEVKEEVKATVDHKGKESSIANEKAEKSIDNRAQKSPDKTKPSPAKATDEAHIDSDLAEIEAAKRRIEALLSGQIEEEPDSSPKKPISEKKKNQIEIIEKFIQNEPQIDRERMAEAEGKTDIEDLADKSLLKDEAFETETLAMLMAKQGKLQRAEDIYKKLSLKFPEKSTYFATQIEKLKSK